MRLQFIRRATAPLLVALTGFAGPARAIPVSGSLPLAHADAAVDAVPAGAGLLIGILVVVLILSIAFAWLRQQSFGPGRALVERWLGRRQSGHDIDVEESARLNPRVSLYSVRWGGRRLLLASGEHGVAVLAERLTDGGESI